MNMFIDMPDNGTHFFINFQFIRQGESEITHYLEEVELKTNLIWYEIDIARSLFVLIFIHRWIAKVACVSCGASREFCFI